MRLLGGTVLIQPIDAEAQVSASGLTLVNHHRKSNLKYLVLAVGPGAWRRRRKKPPVFIVPEVEVGDFILCRADLDDGVVKEALEDGSGRIIIHADGILAKWRQ